MTAFDQFRRKLSHICDGFELMAAAAVGVGVIIAMSGVLQSIEPFWEARMMHASFQQYITLIFNVVIGIEFMKMLCRPHTGNIIEILIFLEARHMIVKDTEPLEDLFAVLSICILFFFRRFMLATKPDEHDEVPGFYQLFAKHWPGILNRKHKSVDDDQVTGGLNIGSGSIAISSGGDYDIEIRSHHRYE